MKALFLFYKRIIITLSAAAAMLLVLSSFITAYSAQVSFSLGGATADIDRLIDLDFTASSDSRLSAVKVTFTYDSRLLEFKKLINSRRFYYSLNQEDGKITIVFADRGIDASGGASVFSLRFKTLDEGDTSVGYTVYECVDDNEEFVQITSCTSGQIKINGKKATAPATKNTRQSATDSTKATKPKPGKGESVTAAEDPSGAEEGTGFSVTEDSAVSRARSSSLLLPIVLIISGSVILAAGSFIAGKKLRVRTEDKEKNGDDPE